jgi:integrase
VASGYGWRRHAAEKPRYGWYTGARQGELVDLRYEDLDAACGLIYFGKTKNRKLKTLPMNQSVKQVLQWLRRTATVGV